MYARAVKSYRTVSVESAPPRRLLDELLNRLLTDCAAARASIGSGDLAGKGKHIGHGLAIVGELVAALDHGVAPELCANLASLYQFVIDRMSHANVHKDAAALLDAEKVVTTLRDAFAQAQP